MLKKSLKWLNENYESLLEGIFVLMLATTIAVLYQRLSGGIEEGFKELNTTYTYKVELASLEVQGNLQGNFISASGGSFILGSGEIKNKQYYIAYKVLEDGGKQVFKMPIEKTVIYDTLDSGSGAYAEIDETKISGIKSIKIYVPKGTITQKYDLSLN